ncbi:MAG: hypothetical protein LBG66_03515 [Gallionellaceae bacterium]|jgi:cytochrome c peroxidase|nr:hypothetical protein [Gallionellaceae bacterium]
MRKFRSSKLFTFGASVLFAAFVLSACGGGGGGSSSSANAGTGAGAGAGSGSGAGTPGGGTNAPTTTSTLSLAAQVGQQLFFDKNLSSNKNQSCASCHDPLFAYGPPNSLAVQLGSDGVSKGERASPSLRYKSMTPAYSDIAENPDGKTLAKPGGGFFWDGRATSLANQAGGPLLNPLEMNNASQKAVVDVVRNASYAALFKQAFGATSLDDDATAFGYITQAIAAFETEDPSFEPYSSKYDLYIGNKIGGTLTAAELRGLSVFNRGDQGNCFACHYQGANFNGSTGLMTDFTYQSIAAPRNDKSIPNNTDPIPANDDATYFDMGLCGPTRADHAPGAAGIADPDPYCGVFKVPTLRNVATRNAFFHNGVFHSLDQVVHFYNTRDTNPEYWYPASGGSGTPQTNPVRALQPTYLPGATVNKYNDLPQKYWGNIDIEIPMGNGDGDAVVTRANDPAGAFVRPAGSAPVMSEQDMQDLVCFLNTLSDGYQPPATTPTTGACVN